MDNKTMQKVINGQEDKIQELSQIVLLLDKKIKELDDKIMAMAKGNMAQALECRIGELEDKINKLDNICVEQYDVLEAKIKELEQKANRTGQFHLDAINEKLSKLDKKIDDLFPSNNDYKKLWQENTDDYNKLARKRLGDYEKIEELESKYYKLRSELDGIYKVLEMDALDIQALQDKTFNGTTREQDEAKYGKRLNNKGDNNE